MAVGQSRLIQLNKVIGQRKDNVTTKDKHRVLISGGGGKLKTRTKLNHSTVTLKSSVLTNKM